MSWNVDLRFPIPDMPVPVALARIGPVTYGVPPGIADAIVINVATDAETMTGALAEALRRTTEIADKLGSEPDHAEIF